MLRIRFESESGDDALTPINIAAALIECETGARGVINDDMYKASLVNLEEIAEHISTFVGNERKRRNENHI